MSSSFWYETDAHGRVNWGVMGGVKSIPKGHRQSVIIMAADSINKVYYYHLTLTHFSLQ